MKRIKVHYEGGDDRVVLECLLKFGLLEGDLEIAKRPKSAGGEEGKEAMVKEAVGVVAPPIAGRAIVLRDLDDLDAEGVRSWFEGRLSVETKEETVEITTSAVDHPRVSVFDLTSGDRRGRVAVVPVGIPDDTPLCQEFEIGQFAVDDYILRLARDEAVYGAISEQKEVPHAKAEVKLAEVAALMKANGLPVKHAKRLLHLFRAITGFRASPAAYAERILKVAVKVRGAGWVKSQLQPLVDDVNWAVSELFSSTTS
jgi:hypothetical protein